MLLTKRKQKACNSAGLNNKAKWSKQNVAKCFCKVRNHAQCFTLNTSGKHHCCFRIKDLNAVSNPKFFHTSIETRPFSEIFKVRDETLAQRDRDIEKRISRPRHVSRHPALVPTPRGVSKEKGLHFTKTVILKKIFVCLKEKGLRPAMELYLIKLYVKNFRAAFKITWSLHRGLAVVGKLLLKRN